MDDLLRQCIDNFGPAPRQLSLWNRWGYMRVTPPAWLKANPSDQLRTLFQNMNNLFRDGVVVWGHIIQANALMFQVGDDNCPGEVVYSIDSRYKVDPDFLLNVAQRIGSLKQSTPEDPALAFIANYLTNERIRVYGVPVPQTISPQVRCFISTTFFVRKHLPHELLCSGYLPLVVNPTEPRVVMPLPAKYWPPALVKEWVGG